ncbi:MAG: acyl-CoA synthetase [Deltaproteobacteria bacterium]|nr:acyl-CoA synthetase [Deltaproteobacteria bacterium]MBW2394840.1 acyl-CoA synthetase [Deltaproteobacteria bacterium]
MACVPLHQLLQEPRAETTRVAWDRRATYDVGAFLRHVGGLARRLEGRPGRKILLDTTSAYAFAVGLFAVARVGGEALVPPNRQEGTLLELSSYCDGVLRDRGANEANPSAEAVTPLDPLAHAGEPWPAELDPQRPIVQLFTSGTTGRAKEIPKAFCHLEEVVELERRVGADLPVEAQVFATAPHQHLYGFLLRVLWPLSTGRAFQAESLLRPEELLPRLADAPVSVLVATPAHLRHLAARPELADLRGRVMRVVSSGGPLPPAVAASVEAALGAPPIEIFGSTETGGVATRRQPAGKAAPHWRPFEGVRVRRDPESGCLRVSSSFVSVGANLSSDGMLEFEMGDQAEVDEDQQFVLQGRADRVVKIGEKRLSLSDMESRLREHAFIDDCGLIAVDRSTEQRVAAVVVLSAKGLAAKADRDRRSLVQTLQGQLAAHWDRVLLPRVWRFVEALPTDERGKLPREALLALVAERPRVPVVLGERREDGEQREDCEQREVQTLVRDLQVPTDLAALEGHFPGQPVVPGVAQLGWALAAAEELAGGKLSLAGVEALKFKEMLLPGGRVRLEVELDRLRARVRFRIFAEDRELSSGRLLLADTP